MIKKQIILLTMVFTLIGCFNDDVKTVEAKIDYPPLAAQSDFDMLQQTSIAEISDVAAAKLLLIDVLARFMNVVQIGNTIADEISDGSTPEPLLKPSARVFRILEASSERCENTSTDTAAVEASIWNDVDNSNTPTVGDEWSYIWNDCKSLNMTFNGVMTFSGMTDPLDQLDSSLVIESFSDFKYALDLQVDNLNSKSVFFRDTSFVFSRAIVDDNEISTLKILADSKMGVLFGDVLYVFVINSATLVSNEDDATLALSLDTRYFNDSSEMSGYFELKTTEDLLFDYDLALTNPQAVVRLLSGNLDLKGKDDITANLKVNSDLTMLDVSIGNEEGETETVEQSLFFSNGKFSLVNLTGIPN